MLDASTLAKQLADSLETDWRSIARPNQLPPEGNWSIWLQLGGRGAGKTRSGSELLRERVESGIARRIALIGSTASDVRDVMVEGPSGILATASSGAGQLMNRASEG
jgi:phage terminase large subunit-like protein